MEYYAVIKIMSSCCKDMDEAGCHHSQQTNTGTEDQTLHILIHKWELNNEVHIDTGRGTSNTRAYWGGGGLAEG